MGIHAGLVYPAGVWMAFYHDMSAVVPFNTELEALRHAVENGMVVRFAAFGDREWLTRDPAATPPPAPSLVCR